MGRRNVGRTLLCASALGLVAAAAPGAASAATNFDCYNVGTSGAPTQHEVGEAEGDAYCVAKGSAVLTIDQIGVTGSTHVSVDGNGTGYATLVYTGGAAGHDGYSFRVSANGESRSISVFTNNEPASNGTPQCSGQESADGPPGDLGIGQERFAGGCFDDEGETGPVTIQVVQSPSRGTLRVDTSDPMRPLVYYRATCSGADDYSFTASDGVNTSAIFSGTVTNAAGTPCTAPTPGPAASPAPVPRAAAPAASFSLKSVPPAATVDSSGNVTIPVTGTPGSNGSVSITADAPKATSASAVAKKKKAKKAKALSLGSKRFTVPASGVAKVKVKVSGAGLKALKKAKKLSAKITVKTDKTTVTKKITLKAPKAKAKKKSKK